ncbi:MAG: hypothetical protein H7835_19040 [Magnetococcus sp. XQGC-1]
MQINFAGQIVAQRQYVDKKGVPGVALTFLEMPSGNQFTATAQGVQVAEADMFKPAKFVIDGQLIRGKAGLFLKVEKIAGLK